MLQRIVVTLDRWSVRSLSRCVHTLDQVKIDSQHQRIGQPSEQDRMPHQPMVPLESFQRWGLDFVGTFKPATARTGD